MQTCLESEQSPLCTVIAIEKTFDIGGCAKIFPLFDKAKKLYADRRARDGLKYDTLFSIELPFVESLCTSTAVNLNLDSKLKLLSEQEQFYQKPASFLFARVLTHLSAHDLDGAWKIARSTYLNPSYTINAPTEKILVMLDGQAEALCAMSEKNKINPECTALHAHYKERISPYILNIEKRVEIQKDWGQQLAVSSYSTYSAAR